MHHNKKKPRPQTKTEADQPIFLFLIFILHLINLNSSINELRLIKNIRKIVQHALLHYVAIFLGILKLMINSIYHFNSKKLIEQFLMQNVLHVNLHNILILISKDKLFELIFNFKMAIFCSIYI
ncbi:hypothetical protein BpHYR1_036028 [Brachionus plicatilis]|uniref:Transmembrane protein n=1 Tax=Brachionus plicatilis TaxID=10195 RepID=A0A3M7S8N0_BRAPC|nr:hypothetical protein BpHYR1_036028 [Brachionus plicatilis]